MKISKLTYRVSHDWTPYRFWVVQAESEIEAFLRTLGKWEEAK